MEINLQESSKFYNRSATMYSQYFVPYFNTAVSSILKYLPITPDDIIVDIGGGTGDVAHRVWKEAKLKNPILCVDPSQGMLEIAKGKDGIETFRATAEEFLSDSEKSKNEPFTKFLLCGCAHLFTDRKSTYSGLKSFLPVGKGRSCILSHLTFLSPLISPASVIYKSGYIQREFELDTEAFDSVGLKWKAFDVVETHPLKKAYWYDFHRNRMLRCIRVLSDSEIEEGIQELEKKYGDQETIDIEVHLKVAILEC